MSQFFASGGQNMLALFYVFRLMPVELVMPSIDLIGSIWDIEGVTHGGPCLWSSWALSLHCNPWGLHIRSTLCMLDELHLPRTGGNGSPWSLPGSA